MKKRLPAVLAAVLAIITSTAVYGASHSDAPAIKQDPQANITDVYSFVGKDRSGTKVLNVLVQVRPFSEPGDGVTYDRFADDARYSIHLTNPTNGATIVRYDFEFSSVSTGFKNPKTILSYGLGTKAGAINHIGDARQNYTQTYTVTLNVNGKDNVIGRRLQVPPPNVGLNVTPFYNNDKGETLTGAKSYGDLDRYTKEAVNEIEGGITVFAGSRDDGFYSDIPGIFDLLNVRILDNNGSLSDGLGQDGNGVDGFKGFNVLSYSIQVPINKLSSIPGFPTVGVYASVSRRGKIYNKDGEPMARGRWVQVNRMGNPLFNEGLVANGAKDKYNRSSPTEDSKDFLRFASNPELAALINFVYGTSFVTTGRTDLEGIFIPDVLRVNTSTESVPLAGEAGFHRLSFLGGDTTAGVPSGWPNGRRPGDDVVDIALTAIASGPTFATITRVGDNVTKNDSEYNRVFPYLATPNSGTFNRKDP